MALADLKRRYGIERNHGAGARRISPCPNTGLSAARHSWRNSSICAASPGDTYTVNMGRNTLGNESAPFASRHSASLRAVYDLAEPDKSMYIHSTGQSGNVLSPLYKNFAERWSRAEYIPMSMKRSDALAESLGTLKLQPR
jgi:penicillin amidase